MFLLLIALAVSLPTFEEFKATHGKVYCETEQDKTCDEHKLRMKIYNQKVEFIRNHNKKSNWTMGVNQFSDLTAEEFKDRYLADPIEAKLETANTAKLSTENLQTSVNWTASGAVTGVKNQGQCGSCWSFSTTGGVEGAAYVADAQQRLTSMSEQQLVDCSTAEGDNGCNGGLMDNAFQYIIDNGGLTTEYNYPYSPVQGTCQQSLADVHVITISGYTDVPSANEQQLMAAVNQHPVSIAVDAQHCWQDYQGGVVTECKQFGVLNKLCGESLDHGVLLTGYGTDETGQDYWIIKNSWGTGWGEAGYIRIARGMCQTSGGVFGLEMSASYPTGVKYVN